MMRLYIIFGILGYIVPAIIVARTFYFRMLEKAYADIAKRVAIQFENKPNSKARAEQNFRENAKSNLQLGIIFVFLLWPAFLIAMLITEGNPYKDTIEKLEDKRAELQDQLIALNSLNPKDLPNLKLSIQLLQEQLKEVEGKLKQYE